MSFSSDVKNELEKQIASARHCQLAELGAILLFEGEIIMSSDGLYEIYMPEEEDRASKKFFTILKKAYNMNTDTRADAPSRTIHGRVYRQIFGKKADLLPVLKAIHVLKDDGSVRKTEEGVNPLLVMKSCCKRAFLRDSFLCVGSISDPSKSYHLEFACDYRKQAEDIKQMIESFGIDARIIIRKKYHVVYIKESTAIVDLLNVMEAPVSLMNMENERIVKEVRGAINRRVNCETANITKTVNAASRQTTDILYLRDHYGFENLPETLRDMAETRLRYPDATLLELGKYLDPQVGKSGVNHRLRKLSELAEKLRG